MSEDPIGAEAQGQAGHGGLHRNDGAEQLVRMANDIGRFFGAEPDREEALAGIANHISKF